MFKKAYFVIFIGCALMTQIKVIANETENVNRVNPYFATSSRYDHIYANPPRHGFGVYGRHIMSSSKVRYIHSPSRMKGVKHAARINANNYAYYN